MNYFEKYFYHLVNTLKAHNKENSVVALQAFDALRSLLQNKEHSQTIKKIINDVFGTLIFLIHGSQISYLLDLIQDLLHDYFHFFDNRDKILDELSKSLNDRILKELSKQEGSAQLSNIYINKSWNIIRSISENPYFLPEYIGIMEKNLFPLFELLKNPYQIDFDEDILLLIAEFIKKSKRITSLQRNLFPFLKDYFQKYNFLFGNLFLTIHYYIVYGKDFFSNDKSCLNLVNLL